MGRKLTYEDCYMFCTEVRFVDIVSSRAQNNRGYHHQTPRQVLYLPFLLVTFLNTHVNRYEAIVLYDVSMGNLACT